MVFRNHDMSEVDKDVKEKESSLIEVIESHISRLEIQLEFSKKSLGEFEHQIERIDTLVTDLKNWTRVLKE